MQSQLALAGYNDQLSNIASRSSELDINIHPNTELGMSAANSLRWLHFSDIHSGEGDQTSLWPRFDTLLLEDLEAAHRKTDGLDLIIFSGDLAQRGDKREFEVFNARLTRIIEQLSRLGSSVQVITVPGNHDLVRPRKTLSGAIALEQYWKNPDLRNIALSDTEDSYKEFIGSYLENYTEWRDEAIKAGLHMAPISSGLLPGDASYSLQNSNGRFGIVALNSTWLQIGAGDYKGELHVDAKQLLSVTDGRPDEWVTRHNANLLVTHHPSNWLRMDSHNTWTNDINPSGRFDLHLFGHMHEPQVVSTSYGSAPASREVQAASLFGLQQYDDQYDRIQGYSVNGIIASDEKRIFNNWPRRLIKVAGGKYKLVPDSAQDIDEETGCISLSYELPRRSTPTIMQDREVRREPTAGPQLLVPSVDLSSIQHFPTVSKAHKKVRKVEQQAALAALKDRRAAWLVSDWGSGEDGFVYAISEELGVKGGNVYIIDFNGFSKGDEFFDELRMNLGASFQSICEAISDVGNSIIILNDVDVGAPPKIERKLLSLIDLIIDFAPSAYILVQSRRRPRSSTLAVVELRPLDEVDVSIYIRESEMGGERYSKPDAVSALYRHTDGVPTRLDEALRSLEVVSLEELVSVNLDLAEAGLGDVDAPVALVSTVNDLEFSTDKDEARAYNLLIALTGLPQGEQLSRLKRIFGPYPIYLPHARTLVERSLVDAVALNPLGEASSEQAGKLLVVPRPVREYIRAHVSEEKFRSFDRKTLELYFGDDWATGNIASSPTGRRVQGALCAGYEIQNGSTLVLRTARRAIDTREKNEILESVRLASAFAEMLMKGDHYRSAATLCKDMINLLDDEEGIERERNYLVYQGVRSLRMIGRLKEAHDEYRKLDLSLLSKSDKQGAELQCALALESLRDVPGARDAARRTIEIDPKTGVAMQARAILVEQIEDKLERVRKLEKLLAAAKKRNLSVLANNLRLTLAKENRENVGNSANYLREVMQTAASDGDHYNKARAIVGLAQKSGLQGSLSDAEKDQLVGAYHYLYNERLHNLFDSCHAALWGVFEAARDIPNLLNLFRHSSFMWRLANQEDKEREYLTKLTSMMEDLLDHSLSLGGLSASRDRDYFAVRISAVMGEVGSVSDFLKLRLFKESP